jgi:DMSO/TMAO reductase YedYZ heme-binding membrane subunit
MSEQFWWYVARASGMVAAVVLILTLIWGLLITTKLIDRRGLPAWLTDLHRYLGGLSVVFIAVHMVALVFDNYLVFSWSDLFVPFASSWKAGPVAWGIGAFWGLVIVEGSSLLQRRMKRSVWRGLHFLSYPVALMTALHAVQAGTDAANVVFRAVSIGLIGVLSALTVFRILYTPQKRSVVPGGSAGGTSAARAAALRAAAAAARDDDRAGAGS